jgi:hypothetical protein
MQTYIIIAQIMGITFTVMGLSLFFNKKITTALVEEVTKNGAVLWTLGFMTLTLGAVLVVFNNVWTSGLELFITIIGWLTLLKGIFIMVFPSTTVSIYKKCKDGSMLAFGGSVAFVLGLILLYVTM